MFSCQSKKKRSISAEPRLVIERKFLVPGHGEPCSDEFVKTMADTMTTAARQATQATRETPDDATKAIPILPYGPEQSRWFIKRLQETRANH